MPQADYTPSVPAIAGPIEFSSQSRNCAGISRRSMLERAAVVGASAALTSLPAAALALPGRGGAASEVDSRFWKAWREWKAVDSAWQADPRDDDETMDQWGEKQHAALVAMLMVPVSTAAAILAKSQSTEGYEVDLPAPAHRTGLMLQADLQRLIEREQREARVPAAKGGR